jgi:hypothetical protein
MSFDVRNGDYRTSDKTTRPSLPKLTSLFLSSPARFETKLSAVTHGYAWLDDPPNFSVSPQNSKRSLRHTRTVLRFLMSEQPNARRKPKTLRGNSKGPWDKKWNCVLSCETQTQVLPLLLVFTRHEFPRTIPGL